MSCIIDVLSYVFDEIEIRNPSPGLHSCHKIGRIKNLLARFIFYHDTLIFHLAILAFPSVGPGQHVRNINYLIAAHEQPGGPKYKFGSQQK